MPPPIIKALHEDGNGRGSPNKMSIAKNKNGITKISMEMTSAV
jgi:hypothetical protein